MHSKQACKVFAVVFSLSIAACAAAPYVCPVIHAVDTICPMVVVTFPDGHQESFRRDDLVAGARRETAMRLAREGSADAGKE